MDIQLKKRRGLRAVHIPYIIGGVAIAALVVAFMSTSGGSTMRVARQNLTVSKVSEGRFEDFVRIDGRVHPISVVHLSPEESGIVVEKVVEEGATVKKGDIIVRLANSDLDLQILNAEAELAEKQNILRNTQISMEQDRLNNRNEQLSLDLDVTRKRRAYEQQQRLYNEQLISREAFTQAREDYELAVKKHSLISQRLQQDSIYRAGQMEQMEDNLQNMQRNVQLIRRRGERLNVCAAIDGELGLLDIELGMRVAAGQGIGIVNDLSDYKVVAQIDEHYIDRVSTGQKATFERTGREYAMTVRKVYPDVRDGKFRCDFVFTGERPDNIRAGQTYYLTLTLGQSADGALLLPRGTFFQSTGGTWAFVLSPDGTRACRRTIRIGRQNPRHYEILEGLQAGEQVITSSYDMYKDNEVLIIE